MSTFRVLLPETWPDTTSADWVLLDRQGQVTRAAHSDPRDWPQAERIEAVLLGAQTSWHKVRVPRASQREQARALPFALEERLLRETDSQHITPSEQGAEQWAVLVAHRERLRRISAQFDAIGRPLDAAWSAAQCVPFAAGSWSYAISGNTACLRSEAHAALPDDIVDDQVPAMLEASVAHARSAGSLPASIRLYGADGINIQAWLQSLSLPIENMGPWRWHELPADAANLLHGEFEPGHRRNAWLRRLRPAAVVFTVAVAAHLILSVGDVMLRNHELSRLRSDMRLLMQQQLPNTPVLDPQSQLRQAVNLARSNHRLLADNEALSILVDLGAALGSESQAALQALRIERNAIDINLVPGKLDAANLAKTLATRGITATPVDGSNTALRLRRTI